MKTKHYDFLVVGLSVVILLGVIGYAQPFVISPLDGLETTNTSILFEFGKADTIFIDDNTEFTSPILINAENDLVVNLKPGTYYWKIKGIGESKIHTLTIVSEIELRLREVGEKYELTNAGNLPLDVEIYNNSLFQGNVVLEVEESENVSGNVFIGRGNENG